MRVALAAVLLLLPAPLWAQGTDDNHRRVFEAAADSVVAIRAMAPLGERSGSGVVLSADGLVLTSYSIVPDGATKIRVWTNGPRLHEAELVAASKREEISLIRLKPGAFGRKPAFKPLEGGDSDGVRIGDVCYTLGNASNCHIDGDGPSFNVGVISGVYRLDEERANSTYVGTVLETTAAVNVGMEGGPLLDSRGRLVGLVTLNYSPNRFLGNAIPWNALKKPVDRLREQGAPAPTPGAGRPAIKGRLGATLADKDGKAVVASVEKGGAAEAAGLAPGMAILAVGDAPIRSAEELRKKLDGLEAGARVYLTVLVDGLEDRVEVELGEEPK